MQIAESTDNDAPTIIQLVHTLTTGGAEVLARQFAVNAVGRFRFVFVCLDECGGIGEDLREKGYTVEVLERRPGLDTRTAWDLGRLIRKHDARLIHAHQYAPFFYASLARRVSRFVPILFTEHGRGYPDFRRSKRVFANRFLLHRRDRVVAVGNCVRQALIDHEGISPERIEVIYNGSDLRKYSSATSERHVVRAECGVAEGELLVLQVARLVSLKDHETAIRAVVQAVRQGAPLQLRLAGEGPERPRLESLIAELDAGDCVQILGLRNDVPRLLAAADICVLSSLTEGIPLVLIEAMAARIPCVATRVGGNAEVIEEGITGLLAEVSDPRSLCDCLMVLSGDGDRRKAMGIAAEARAHAMFDEREMLEAYNRVYHEMIGLRSSGHAARSVQASGVGETG